MNAAKLHHRGIEEGDLRYLIEAHDWIAGLADSDCSCDWNDSASCVHNPCEVCQARRARDALAQVLDPKPRTLHPDRLSNEAERVYYELWEKENERHPGINGGYTLIEHLLCPSDSKRCRLTGMHQPDSVSQHDMTIATTIIQWLGTNCGLCFMQTAEREIEKRRADRVDMGNFYGGTPDGWALRQKEGREYQIADSIASTFVGGKPELETVRNSLRQAILNAIAEFRKRERQEILASIGSTLSDKATQATTE